MGRERGILSKRAQASTRLLVCCAVLCPSTPFANHGCTSCGRHHCSPPSPPQHLRARCNHLVAESAYDESQAIVEDVPQEHRHHYVQADFLIADGPGWTARAVAARIAAKTEAAQAVSACMAVVDADDENREEPEHREEHSVFVDVPQEHPLSSPVSFYIAYDDLDEAEESFFPHVHADTLVEVQGDAVGEAAKSTHLAYAVTSAEPEPQVVLETSLKVEGELPMVKDDKQLHVVNGQDVCVYFEKDTSAIQRGACGAKYVCESKGVFTAQDWRCDRCTSQNTAPPDFSVADLMCRLGKDTKYVSANFVSYKSSFISDFGAGISLNDNLVCVKVEI